MLALAAYRKPMSTDRNLAFRLIRFWLLCGLVFASPAIFIAFLALPVAEALLISAVFLVVVLAGPFSRVWLSVIDMQLDDVSLVAIGGGTAIVVLLWVLLRRDTPTAALKGIIVGWCFLGFVLAIIPVLAGIT